MFSYPYKIVCANNYSKSFLTILIKLANTFGKLNGVAANAIFSRKVCYELNWTLAQPALPSRSITLIQYHPEG